MSDKIERAVIDFEQAFSGESTVSPRRVFFLALDSLNDNGLLTHEIDDDWIAEEVGHIPARGTAWRCRMRGCQNVVTARPLEGGTIKKVERGEEMCEDCERKYTNND